jgi:hypothetical protein
MSIKLSDTDQNFHLFQVSQLRVDSSGGLGGKSTGRRQNKRGYVLRKMF